MRPIEGATKPATAAPLEVADEEDELVLEVLLLPELPSRVVGVAVDVHL